MTVKTVEDDALVKRKAMNEAILSGDSTVQKFYENAVILITGGSGFLGKHLIFKLMSSCNLNKLFVLLRPRKGMSVHERLKSILEDPVFKILHNEKPDFVTKLVAVEGDSAENNLGLDKKTWTMISDEVNVIFHAAATVNFKETIKVATLTNVRSAREVLNLAKASKNIKAVVHVSTAYIQATKRNNSEVIKEDFYECPISPEVLIKLAETVDEDKLDAMMEPIMKEWPNSYTFTKAVAEELIRTDTANFPICIVRPAIVISAYRDPLPGWIDLKNAYGPSGLILGAAVGVVHTFYSKSEAIIDYVPVDIVNNTIILAAWDIFDRFKIGDKKKLVYTVTGTKNPLKYMDIDRIMNSKKFKELMPTKAVWHSYTVATRYKFLYLMLTWLLHYIPGLMIDGCCTILGKEPKFFKIYNMAYNLSIVYAHFLNNSWIFDGTNTSNLYNKLSTTDKIIYNCEMSTIDKEDMLFTWCYGIHKYILKDDLTRHDYAMKKQFYLKIVNCIFFPLYLFGLYKLVSMSGILIFKILIAFYNNILINFLKC
ncbi:unnamed protein product [Euphydryas editha]|uniref:Fatty acyl-CoA reductase n=1 Tax=Euphydryas editha TaxID=104508 RepID=A0AAU9UUX1_EUPED|nr:unnamed protein product [Euphydryas editha]